MKSENEQDPPVDNGRGIQIRVREHSLDIPRVRLDDEVAHADEEQLESLENAVLAIELQLRLTVLGFALVKGD